MINWESSRAALIDPLHELLKMPVGPKYAQSLVHQLMRICVKCIGEIYERNL